MIYLNRDTKGPGGLKALPEKWIPMGQSRGTITTAVASGEVEVGRESDRLTLDATNPVYPDLTCSDLGQGRVRLWLDMPWPIRDVTLNGPMDSQGETVLLQDEQGAGTCELTQPAQGQVHGLVRRPGSDDIWFLYIQGHRPVKKIAGW